MIQPYDDTHGAVVLFYDLLSAGYEIEDIYYDDVRDKYTVLIRRWLEALPVIVENLTGKDIDSILALEAKMGRVREGALS